MTPQPPSQASSPAATAAPSGSPGPATSPVPSPQTRKPAVPTPSLKPGEVITWVKLERPRFAIGEIVISSFAIVGVAILMAVGLGMVLGHFRSKRTGTHGAGGLGLR